MLVIERKMYLADTDATGFVYYARYLEWMKPVGLIFSLQSAQGLTT
jgi:hypothetical protein